MKTNEFVHWCRGISSFVTNLINKYKILYHNDQSVIPFMHKVRYWWGVSNSYLVHIVLGCLFIVRNYLLLYSMWRVFSVKLSDAEALRDLANTLMNSIRMQSTGSVTPSVLVSSLINKFSKKGRIGNNQRRKISVFMFLHFSKFVGV